MKGNKTEMYHWTLGGKNCSLWFFFLLWKISKWISLLLQMFSLVLFGGTRLATSAVSDARRPVSRQVSRSGVGEGECPLSASLLWSSGCQAAAPQRSTSSRAPLDPPSVWQRKAAPPRLANHGSPPHTASPMGGPATTRPCCRPALSPHLSVLWHKDHFSWKM